MAVPHRVTVQATIPPLQATVPPQLATEATVPHQQATELPQQATEPPQQATELPHRATVPARHMAKNTRSSTIQLRKSMSLLLPLVRLRQIFRLQYLCWWRSIPSTLSASMLKSTAWSSTAWSHQWSTSYRSACGETRLTVARTPVRSIIPLSILVRSLSQSGPVIVTPCPHPTTMVRSLLLWLMKKVKWLLISWFSCRTSKAHRLWSAVPSCSWKRLRQLDKLIESSDAV